ncbi:TetR/AcrR family transcriptional regulator [Aldersonia kunmingensis]|uniref:TetR/AcrR family transcriptional regulator n=1 Tax=Aldersonia kunmingensis TaxID=408066 RepID=UPI00083573DD|nr:TetR/AcrR family transcriptional regulator [Aldersonia kunmingensis]
MSEVSLRRTQRERRADSEQRLLNATAELIVERGFDQLSLVAIGERAGCSHALVNHLFGTKAALIERLNDAVDDLYRARVDRAIAGKDGAACLLAFVGIYLQLVTSSDPLARVHVVLCAQAVAGSPELRGSRAKWDRHFRDGVAELVRLAYRKKRIDAFCTSTAFAIVGLLRGIAMQHMIDPKAVSLRTATARASDAVNGLLASLDSGS